MSFYFGLQSNGSYFQQLPSGIVFGYSPTTFPIVSSRSRPDAVKCPICLDNEFNPMFYFTSDPDWREQPKRPNKADCEACGGRGLHPIPMTELYDIVDLYDVVDLD